MLSPGGCVSINKCSKIISRPSLRCLWLGSQNYASRPSFVNKNPNHYQVLGIKKDASSEDIRNAFLKLSKDYHPDINSEDPQNHDKFVGINEAYTVLSRPLMRREYDIELLLKTKQRPNISRPHSSDEFDPSAMYYDPYFYTNRDKSQDSFYRQQPYYGVNGISKVSNRTIVYICVGIILIGAVFDYVVVKKLSDIHIESLNVHDRKAHQLWLKANDPGFIAEQMEQLKIKIEEGEEKRKKSNN